MTASRVLLAVGYPTALVGLVRLRHTFRRRRLGWLLVEEAGVAAIVAGWLLAGGPRQQRAAAINAVWGAGLALAWVVVRRRRRRQPIL